jgi:C1A family cysteine protease
MADEKHPLDYAVSGVVPRKVQRYGWKPDLPGLKKAVRLLAPPPGGLPAHSDLRKRLEFSLFDQLDLGSCTGNALSAAMKYRLALRAGSADKVITPSRLMVYYDERYMEGSIYQDAGAMIADGVTSLQRWGACDERLWPYDPRQFTHRPPLTAYKDAAGHRLVSSHTVLPSHDQVVAHLCRADADGGPMPVVFGFTVYESFESQAVASSGQVPMPSPGEKAVGGHAVTVWGHDDAAREYLVRNSWGDRWGLGGYFRFPYDYLHNPSLCSDFHALDAFTG